MLITCPNTGETVATGVTMTELEFERLGEESVFSLRCSACSELHTWAKGDARLERLLD